MASLQKIISWFQTGLFPTSDQFRQTWLSFWHKSEKLPITQVMGLDDELNSKATKDDLNNIVRGLINRGEVSDIVDLNGIQNPQDGWAYIVKNDKNEFGNSYIYRYTITKDLEGNIVSAEWINTKLVSFDLNFDSRTFLYDVSVAQIKEGIKTTYSTFNDAFSEIPDNAKKYITQIKYIDSNSNEYVAYQLNTSGSWEKYDFLKIDQSNEFAYAIVDASGNLLFSIQKDGSPCFPMNELLNKGMSNEFVYAITDVSDKPLFAIRKDGSPYFPKNELLNKDVSNEFLYAITDVSGRVLFGVRKNGSVLSPLTDSTSVEKDDYYSKSDTIQIAQPTSVARVDIDINLSYLTGEKNSVPAILEYRDNTGIFFKKPITIAYQGTSSMGFVKKNFSIDVYNDDARSEECKIKFGDWAAQDSFHLKANYIDAMHTRNVVCNRLWDQILMSRPIGGNYPYQIPYTYGWEGQRIDDSNQTIDQRYEASGARCHVDGFPIELYIRGEYWGLYTWNLKKHRSNYLMKKNNQSQILMELSGNTLLKLYKAVIYPSVSAMNAVIPESFEVCFVNNQDGSYDLYFAPTVSSRRKLGTKTAAQMEVIHTDEPLAYTYEVKWKVWELRNPSVDSIWKDGDEFEPVESPAKRSIYNFLQWCGNNTVKTVTRESIAEHMQVGFSIDYYLFCEFIDAWDLAIKNTLYSTYDGVHWLPNPYDLDCVFGNDWQGKFLNTDPLSTTTNTQQPILFIKELYSEELKSRYKELREQGIFTPENIHRLFSEFTNRIGSDFYKKDQERWPSIPSANDDSFFSIGQIVAWVERRIRYMDNKYLK